MKPKELSTPIYELLCSLQRPPAELHKCKTIYQAVRASRKLRWRLPINRFSAVCSWATCVLVAHDQCRKHLTRLIANELEGERWVMTIASAVNPLTQELDRLDANRTKKTVKDRTRTFLQHRDAAVRALKEARTHLAAIECKPSIQKLIDHSEYELLHAAIDDLARDQHGHHQAQIELARRQLEDEGVPTQHQWAELINRGLYFQENPIPNLDFVIQAAIVFAAEAEAPEVDRHSVLGQFLRNLYKELEDTAIGNVRIAFLCHAANALFDQAVDKAQVRRLVKDIAEEIAARNERLEAVGLGKEWAKSFLQELRGDTSLQGERSLQSSQVLSSGRETFKQSRQVSGRSEKVQNESTSAHPVRRNSRPSTAGKSPASARSSSANRKKP